MAISLKPRYSLFPNVSTTLQFRSSLLFKWPYLRNPDAVYYRRFQLHCNSEVIAAPWFLCISGEVASALRFFLWPVNKLILFVCLIKSFISQCRNITVILLCVILRIFKFWNRKLFSAIWNMAMYILCTICIPWLLGTTNILNRSKPLSRSSVTFIVERVESSTRFLIISSTPVR